MLNKLKGDGMKKMLALVTLIMIASSIAAQELAVTSLLADSISDKYCSVPLVP